MLNQDNLIRCPWVDLTKEDYVRYHDLEWGVPVYDDRLLFEFITLEGAHAGPSVYPVLRSRGTYRAPATAFAPVNTPVVSLRSEPPRFHHTALHGTPLPIHPFTCLDTAHAFLPSRALQ